MTPCDAKPLVVTLMGPTASGKTAFALELAKQLDVALISVDSAMVYRGLDIGTAKPPAEILQANPHALVDIRDPEEDFSAQQFCTEADIAVKLAFKQGKLPILVGGSMMYFRAFRNGLADLPSADASIRKEIRTLALSQGTEAVHAELRRVDPDAAAVIDPRNLKRLERALEVYRITGIPMTSLWRKSATPGASDRLNCDLLEFTMPEQTRQTLHERIETRLQSMFKAGFVDEVQRLRERPNLTAANLSMRTVGYREIWACLNAGGDATNPNVFERVLVATRQLARKQLTWLRSWPATNTRIATSVNDVKMLCETRFA